MRLFTYIFVIVLIFPVTVLSSVSSLEDDKNNWIDPDVELYSDPEYDIDQFLFTLGIIFSNNNENPEEEYAEYYPQIDSILAMVELRDSILKETLDNNGHIIHHVVEKGEDWESIADDYQISQLDLMWANPFEEDCYAGLELSIPVLLSDEELREFQLTVKNSYYIEGKKQYDKGDYSKAKKTYDKIIGSPYTSLLAYYNRGMAQYKNGKLREAINDFTHVISHDPLQRFPDAKGLKEHAAKLQAERDEERAEGIANLINFASHFAMEAFQYSQGSPSKTLNPSPTTNSSGYDNNEDYSPGNSISSPKSRKVCRSCNGGGECSSCHGTGKRTDNLFGHGTDPKYDCGVCGGKGTCVRCGGTGYQS